MATSPERTRHRDRSDHGQPGSEIGQAMVRDVRKVLCGRMAKAGVHEVVNNPDVADENQHRRDKPCQARDEDVRLFPSRGSRPEQDHHSCKGRERRCCAAQVPRRVSRNVITALERELLGRQRPSQDHGHGPPVSSDRGQPALLAAHPARLRAHRRPATTRAAARSGRGSTLRRYRFGDLLASRGRSASPDARPHDPVGAITDRRL